MQTRKTAEKKSAKISAIEFFSGLFARSPRGTRALQELKEKEPEKYEEKSKSIAEAIVDEESSSPVDVTAQPAAAAPVAVVATKQDRDRAKKAYDVALEEAQEKYDTLWARYIKTLDQNDAKRSENAKKAATEARNKIKELDDEEEWIDTRSGMRAKIRRATTVFFAELGGKNAGSADALVTNHLFNDLNEGKEIVVASPAGTGVSTEATQEFAGAHGGMGNIGESKDQINRALDETFSGDALLPHMKSALEIAGDGYGGYGGRVRARIPLMVVAANTACFNLTIKGAVKYIVALGTLGVGDQFEGNTGGLQQKAKDIVSLEGVFESGANLGDTTVMKGHENLTKYQRIGVLEMQLDRETDKKRQEALKRAIAKIKTEHD